MEKLPDAPPGANRTPPQRPARGLSMLLWSSSMLPPVRRYTTPPSFPQLERATIEVDCPTVRLCTGVRDRAAAQNDRGAVDQQSPARCARVAVGESDGLEQKLRTVQLKHPRKVLSVEHSTLAIGDQMQIDRSHDDRGAA
eukprot:5247835-Prymnesium_polylepis.2